MILKSYQDGIVEKIIFEENNMIAETVLYQYENRIVVCFSCQSGCPIGCSFCGTGKKFIKNLSYTEMLIQIEEALGRVEYKDNKEIQIMAMSMGEPMLNYKAVRLIALRYLERDMSFYISTIGIKDFDILNDFMTLGIKYNKFGLQFSLHETYDCNRFSFIEYPKDKLLTILDMISFAKLFNTFTGKLAYFNYIVYKYDIIELDNIIKLITEYPIHITLSVKCDTNNKIKGDIQLVNKAKDYLYKNTPFECRKRISTFNPEGQDTIGGGCGQLWYVQKKLNAIKETK